LTPDQQAGSVLDGKYEVLEHLGGGGMGEVHLVRHIHLEEKRVVKILRPDRVGDPDAQKRFLREARFATQIKHPNVAILYDYSRLDDGSFYMVWEYIEGEDVGSRVRREGPLPIRQAIDLTIQALHGLNAIHGAGMIHRDVSPDNLMVAPGKDGRLDLKIIDLGLAKGLEPDPDYEVTQDGMFMGKLLYCAPEQAGLHKGETLDNRTDLYSMAIVLYEMLTAMPPFEAETPQGAIFKRLSEDPLPMAGRNPSQSIPRDLDAIVLRALARERDERYPDAVAFIEALESFAAGLAPAGPAQRETGAQAPPASAPRAPAQPARTPPSQELSRAEKSALLAQIEAAARRQKQGELESSKMLDHVDALLTGDRLGEARQVVARLEQENPRSRALPKLRERLASAQARREEGERRREAEQPQPPQSPQPREPQAAPAERGREVEAALQEARNRLAGEDTDGAREAVERAKSMAGATGVDPNEVPEIGRLERQVAALERTAERRTRVDEATALVERYLKTKQVTLAKLALDTLRELSPNHPKAQEYERWIGLAAEEAKDDKRAEELIETARESIRTGDFKNARRNLSQLEKVDPDQAAALDREITTAETEEEKTADFEEHRERLERLIAERRLEDAQQEIKALGDLGAAKVTLDLWRARLAEARTNAVGDAQADVFFEAFRERLAEHDFRGARAVAGEFQRTSPDHPRIAEMFAEVTHLERERDRERSIEQGESQVEELIKKGDAGQAALALKLLLQLAPDHKKRKAFEKKIAKLQR